MTLIFSKGIQVFLRETVKDCSKNGFVKTLLGRKRFLPGIKESNMYIKSHVRFFIRPLQFDRNQKAGLFQVDFFHTLGRTAGCKYNSSGLCSRYS